MPLICPNPQPWDTVYQRLKAFATKNSCTPSSPPIPLILNGWVYSNDLDKILRWRETVEWASANGCSDIIDQLLESDYYFANIPII